MRDLTRRRHARTIPIEPKMFRYVVKFNDKEGYYNPDRDDGNVNTQIFNIEHDAIDYAIRVTKADKGSARIEKEMRISRFYPWEIDHTFSVYVIKDGHRLND